ncbi:hypothetical protein BS17DRAFT_786985 [Gyrodon lividus]|nr:hypothetical protein BS17DRAFT_786985 [Gyrodon lividus]
MGRWVIHVTQPRQEAPSYEQRVQAAISGVAHGIYPSYRAAAAAQQVSKSMVFNRAHGTHKSRKEGRTELQLLTPAQKAAQKRLKPRHGWQELITMLS